MDETLRRRERARAQGENDLEAQVQVLVDRLRTGALEQSTLECAAYAGHYLARHMLGDRMLAGCRWAKQEPCGCTFLPETFDQEDFVCVDKDVQWWLRGLEELWPQHMLRFAVNACEALLRQWRLSRDLDLLSQGQVSRYRGVVELGRLALSGWTGSRDQLRSRSDLLHQALPDGWCASLFGWTLMLVYDRAHPNKHNRSYWYMRVLDSRPALVLEAKACMAGELLG